VREEADGVLRAARPREVDEPDAVRELGLEGTRGLDGEPTLADAGCTGERHEAGLVQDDRDLGELILASDERRHRRGQIAKAPADDRDGGDRGVVREDRLLEPPKLGPWLEPALVGEHAPRLLERVERVRLAAAAVQRQHQHADQLLARRMSGCEPFQFRNHQRVLPLREPRVDELLLCEQPEFFEPGNLALRKRFVLHVGGNHNFTVRREFNCIADQIGQNLTQPHRVAKNYLWHSRIDMTGELQAFFVGS